MKQLLVFFIGLEILVACNNKQAVFVKADVLASNMDTSVQPDDDIFMYANGGWIKKNPILGEESQWGIGNLVIE